MPSRVTDISQNAQYVVFTNTQVYDPPYDSRDTGGYSPAITEQFFDTDEKLNEFLKSNIAGLNNIRVYKLTPVQVSVETKLSFK